MFRVAAAPAIEAHVSRRGRVESKDEESVMLTKEEITKVLQENYP